MVPFNNFIFVTIEKMFEDKISSPSGNLELELASFSSTIVDSNDDEIYNINKKRVNYGKVVGIPRHLTASVLLSQEDLGEPLHGRYIDHDTVKKIGVHMIQYQCGLYEPKWKTLADVKMEVMVEDKIYFHYHTLDDENKLKSNSGEKLYKLAYQNAICVVRDGCIMPVSGHVLVEPHFEEDVVDIGDNIKAKVSAAGVITEANIKPTYLKGIVRYIGTPLRGDNIDFNIGDTIIYFPNADWEVIIEGKTYYCMKYWDVLATFENITKKQ